MMKPVPTSASEVSSCQSGAAFLLSGDAHAQAGSHGPNWRLPVCWMGVCSNHTGCVEKWLRWTGWAFAPRAPGHSRQPAPRFGKDPSGTALTGRFISFAPATARAERHALPAAVGALTYGRRSR